MGVNKTKNLKNPTGIFLKTFILDSNKSQRINQYSIQRKSLWH